MFNSIQKTIKDKNEKELIERFKKTLEELENVLIENRLNSHEAEIILSQLSLSLVNRAKQSYQIFKIDNQVKDGLISKKK